MIIVPKRSRPSPIFVVALLGPERILRRDFDLTRGPESFVEQALAMVPDSLVAFGETAGFTINFTPDYAEQFDMQGNAVATFSKAVRAGEADPTLKDGPRLWGYFARRCPNPNGGRDTDFFAIPDPSRLWVMDKADPLLIPRRLMRILRLTYLRTA